MCPRDLARPTAVLAGLLFAAVSLAQQAAPVRKSAVTPRPAPANQVLNRQDFGTTSLTFARTSGLDFYPYQGTAFQTYQSAGNYRWSTTASFSLEGPIRVPTGAIIDYIEVDACDFNATPGNDLSLSLIDCDVFGGGCLPFTTITTNLLSGCGTVSLSPVGYQVDNGTRIIGFEAVDPVGDGSIMLGGAVVGYHLQVSPAPGTASFADVETDNLYFQFIEAIKASGVTAGCDGVPNFCPDRPITRAEMAVFLAKALGLHFAN